MSESAEDFAASPRLAELRENSLLSLFELSHELGASRDPFALAELVALNAMGHFGARRAALWGFPEEWPDGAATLRAFGLTDADLATLGRELREACELEPAGGDAMSALELSPRARAAGLVLAVPVVSHGRRLGAFALGERVGGVAYQGLDVDYVTASARMFGAALENARLHHSMAESNRRLRRANADLTETDRLKAEFVANVNHEMRTPITAILGYLDVLTTTGGLSEFQSRALMAMTAQGKRLGRVVQDLLEYSSLSGGATRVEGQPTDVADLVAGFADERRPGVLEGMRALQVEIDAGTPRALADARRLEKVLEALVDNAVKFTPPGSRIVIRASAARREVVRCVAIEVEDDGPGIPRDRLQGLFDAFRQGDGSSTRTVGGMGLGLALARQHAEAMGATLEAESEPGRGSIFRLLLRAA